MVRTSRPSSGHDRDTSSSSSDNYESNFDQSSTPFNVDQLLDGIFHTLQKLWLQGRRIFNLIMSEYGGNDLVDAVIKWCIQHPDIAICIVAASLVFLLPLMIIFGFGIAALAITFTGILVLEGTLLTVFIMIFLACIGSLAIAVAFFAVVAYFGFSQICDFMGMERHRDTFIKYMQQNRRTQSAESSQNTT